MGTFGLKQIFLVDSVCFEVQLKWPKLSTIAGIWFIWVNNFLKIFWMTVLFRPWGYHESEVTPTKRNCDICGNILLWDGFVHGMWHFKCKLYKLNYAHPSIRLHWLLVAERINVRLFSQTLKALLNGRLTEKLHKKTLKDSTCNNQTMLRSAGDNDRSSSAMVCVKFHARGS